MPLGFARRFVVQNSVSELDRSRRGAYQRGVRRMMPTRTNPPPLTQTCKACGQRDLLNFHVHDEVWTRIVPPEFSKRVVCLQCFDDLAAEAGQTYELDGELFFFGEAMCFSFQPVDQLPILGTDTCIRRAALSSCTPDRLAALPPRSPVAASRSLPPPGSSGLATQSRSSKSAKSPTRGNGARSTQTLSFSSPSPEPSAIEVEGPA